MIETPQEIAARADHVLTKCRRRGHASLSDVENLRSAVHTLAEECGPAAAVPLSYAITWDHDFVRLWCSCCPDDSDEVECFAGNPTSMAEIFKAMREHAATHTEDC